MTENVKKSEILLLSLRLHWLQLYDKITSSDFWGKIFDFTFNVVFNIVITAFLVIRFSLRLITDIIIIVLLYVAASTVVNYYPINAANFYPFIYQILPYAILIPLILVFKRVILSYFY
jgi:hypothetical protein